MGDHCIKIGSGATPKGGKESYLDTGPYSLIRSQNVYNDGFSWQGLAYISDEQAKKLDGVAVERNDVLVNITGDSVARVCNAPSAVLPARVNQHVAIVRPRPESFDSDYLRWYLCLPEQQEKLLGLASAGATRNALTKAMLENLRIPQPPIDVQKSIAALPVAISQRIELLLQTNATLESIAQALFKSWFIDFDPVRAKAEGREPEGLDAETAALFPDTFEDSAFGQIPKGWTGNPFGELLSFAIGGDWGAEGPTDTCTQPATIIRGTDIPDMLAGQFDGVPRRFVSPKKSEKRSLQDGDLVIEISGGSATQPTGRSLYVTKYMLAKLGVVAVPTSFCRLFRAADAHTALLLSQHLTAIYQAGKMWNYQVQSTGLANFQTQHFLGSEIVVVPPSHVRKAFFDIVRPLIDRASSAPIAELQALRDALLPRLISGKLRLSEAEAQLNEALA